MCHDQFISKKGITQHYPDFLETERGRFAIANRSDFTDFRGLFSGFLSENFFSKGEFILYGREKNKTIRVNQLNPRESAFYCLMAELLPKKSFFSRGVAKFARKTFRYCLGQG
jgi:hypothetical protein